MNSRGEHEESLLSELLTSSGAREREWRSARWNRIEALGAVLTVLIVLWIVGYFLGVYCGWPGAQPVAIALLGGCGLFVLVVSPRLHGDSLDAWGVGSPGRLLVLLKTSTKQYKILLTALILVLFLLLTVLGYLQWPALSGALRLPKNAARLQDTLPGQTLVLVTVSLLSVLVVSSAIRYDNLWQALRATLCIAVPLCFYVCASGFLLQGPTAFAEIDAGQILLGLVGYTFWGYLQQLLFSGYFNTRLRKGFPQRDGCRAAPTPAYRLALTLTWGALAALAAAWLAQRGFGDKAEAPYIDGWLLPASFAVMTFPVGALFGHYYARDRLRMRVSVLAASIFAVLHIDAYPLLAATWILGIPLAYVFMEDRNRNLLAMGFVHGLLGSTLSWLFFRPGASPAFVSYYVGPWNVHSRDLGALVVPVLCVCVYALVLAATWRYSPKGA